MNTDANGVFRAMSGIGGDLVGSASEENTRVYFAAARRRRLRLSVLAVAACLVLVLVPAAFFAGRMNTTQESDGENGTVTYEYKAYVADSCNSKAALANAMTLKSSVKIAAGTYEAGQNVMLFLDLAYSDCGYISAVINPGDAFAASDKAGGAGEVLTDPSPDSEAGSGDLSVIYPSDSEMHGKVLRRSTTVILTPADGTLEGGTPVTGETTGCVTVRITYIVDSGNVLDTSCTLTIPYTVNNGAVTFTADK